MGKHKKEKKEKLKKDKEKKRRRRSSPSDSSSSDSESSEDYKRRKAEKLAKKLGQHLKKHKVTGTGYTNEDNPFGDTNLTERFVWGKKLEKAIVEGRDVREMTAKAEMKRQAERLEEIEKVKRRREQREAEKAAMAEELELIQRERALAEAADLEKKEEEFHLEQAKARTQQRLADRRPKPIDLLAATILQLDVGDRPTDEPYTLLTGLTLRELKYLRDDISAFQELDKHDPLHVDFWSSLALVAAKQLEEVQKQEDLDRARLRGDAVPAKYTVREAGWHASIDTEVQVMLAGKTHRELVELEAGIQEQLDSGTAADPEYWQAVLRRLQLHKAKARLREIHADLMQQQLARMMAGVDVPGAMGWGQDGGEEQEEEEEEEEGGEPQLPLTEEERQAALAAAAAAKAAAADDNEIELAEDDEEEGEGGGAAAVAGGETGEQLDAELAALAAVGTPGQQGPAGKSAEEVAADTATAAKERQKQAARGEPRSWEDLSDGEQEVLDLGEAGSYSPQPLPPTAYAGQDVVPEEEDSRLLELLRAQVKYREVQRYRQASAAAAAARPAQQAEADRIFRRVTQNPGEAARMLGGGAPMTRYLAQPARGSEDIQAEDAAEAAFRATAARMMGDLGTSGDAPFGGEVQVQAAQDAESQVYWWHEKYRPRRPKYFNRVHTGYEWNKYNQTHYDGDNPPPKTVQGYKFNIFYPELLDKTVAPTYKVERDPSAPDGSTCILRFTAGPPYEDLAFRIINKEWEYNHKRGFKCVFERGILHLYFNFRRQRYRR